MDKKEFRDLKKHWDKILKNSGFVDYELGNGAMKKESWVQDDRARKEKKRETKNKNINKELERLLYRPLGNITHLIQGIKVSDKDLRHILTSYHQDKKTYAQIAKQTGYKAATIKRIIKHYEELTQSDISAEQENKLL